MRFGSPGDDAFEHISEQCHRLDAIEFGGLNECHGDCPVTGSAIGAGEERGVSFGSTVSHASLAVGNIAIERIGRLSHTAQKVGHIVCCKRYPKCFDILIAISSFERLSRRSSSRLSMC